MKQYPLPLFGTLAGAILTTIALVVIDSPLLQAQTAEETPEQVQEDVAERARDLVERFTQQRQGPDSEPTEPTEGIPEEEVFDPGPMETFTETQGLEEPVEDLPGSGLGIPIASLALGLTAVRHRKRLSKYLPKR